MNWLREGIKGWKNAGLPTVGKTELLEDLMKVNTVDFNAMLVSEEAARQLNNCIFVDFRDKAKYESGHINGANHVNHGDMFSKLMMEELNKSNSLVIVHDAPVMAGSIAMTLKLMDYPSVYILHQ